MFGFPNCTLKVLSFGQYWFNVFDMCYQFCVFTLFICASTLDCKWIRSCWDERFDSMESRERERFNQFTMNWKVNKNSNTIENVSDMVKSYREYARPRHSCYQRIKTSVPIENEVLNWPFIMPLFVHFTKVIYRLIHVVRQSLHLLLKRSQTKVFPFLVTYEWYYCILKSILESENTSSLSCSFKI